MKRRNFFSVPRSLRSRPRLSLLVAGIVVVGAAVGGWAATNQPAAPAETSLQRLFTVRPTTMSRTLSTTGTIEPATTKTLSFSATGQVTTVDAQVGEHVTEGETLAILDSASLKAQAAQAAATLAGAQSRLSQDESGSASSTQLAADQASVNAAQSQVDSANSALSGATLTSPIDGIVTAVGLTAGQQLSGGGGAGAGGNGNTAGSDGGNGGSTGGSDDGSGSGGSNGNSGGSGGSGSGSSDSITVVSTGSVINANVDATVVSQIKYGDQVSISTEGAPGPVTGTVASIGLIASVSSGVATFPVVINVNGTPSGLYAGASATATITYSKLTNVLAVPAPAVVNSGGRTVVYTVTNGHQVARPVTTGLTTNGLTQITSGLTAGQQVVVNLTTINLGPGQGNGGGLLGPGGPNGNFKVRGGVPGGGIVQFGG